MTNPYIQVITSLFSDAKGWIMMIVGAITLFKVAQYVMQYQGGEADEKAHSVKLIRNTLMMGGGGFFLIWFADQIFQAMQKVS
ncbi:hypothetical protein [Clostridium sp.]|uniref:hypothetical protein n=1 Tax=Clostridium sp. TaxID=1506 RepID=UPI003F3EBCD9